MDKNSTSLLKPQQLQHNSISNKPKYNIVITGKNSRIGNRIEAWLKSHPNGVEYNIYQLDVITDDWKKFDFSNTDVVIHVAAIVHRPDCDDWNLYQQVNAQLPVEIAKKAKNDGVSQFIFFSTMAVYGIGKVLGVNEITADTIPNPNSMYGKSKFMAEQGLQELYGNSFNIAIVRPPNVYGGSERDYVKTFCKWTKILPVLPIAYEDVKQSMVFIDNLTEFIRLLIIQQANGVFLLQDESPVSSLQLMECIKKAYHQPIRLSRVFGWFVHLASFIPFIRKVMGGVYYSPSITSADINYIVVPFDEAINRLVDEMKNKH